VRTSIAPPALVTALLVVSLSGAVVIAGAQPGRPAAPAPSSGVHAGHGTPRGWKFTWPSGDPVKGRAVFERLECWSCHVVKGEGFADPKDDTRVGPELSMMGPLHEAEYFAEAVINPSAVIEKGHGYAAPDGSSKMPSFNDALTVQEAIDLVAYLKVLAPPAARGTPAGHGPHGGHGKH
jgi:mono/diheme cytochrome c family protein